MPKKRYVVIGEGAAGATAAEELRRLDPHAAIGVFTEEPHPSYYRAALTNYLLGELREDQLFVNPPDFYESQRIARAFTRVVHIDAARGEVWDTSSSHPTPFDALLVASGARPRPAPFEGGLLPGVVTLRTLFDARMMMDTIKQGTITAATVLGGGPLGLEWASALLERGIKVTLIERSRRLMASALDDVASDLLAARLRTAGIDLLLGEEVAAARPNASGRVGALMLRSGRELYADFVAIALGVLPNTEFLRSAGLRMAASGALLVDRTLQSSAPNVWGAGDAVSVEGEELALWEPAKHQGRTAARNMLGGRMRYEPGAHYFATRLFDLDFAKIGDIKPGPGREEVIDFPRGTGKIAYKKLVLEHGRLVGALMLGERSLRVRTAGRVLKRLVDTKADVAPIKDRIHASNFDLAGWLDSTRLVAKPSAPHKTFVEVAPAAKLRGTQAVRMPSAIGTAALQMPVAASPSPGTQVIGGLAASAGMSAAPSAPGAAVRGTRLLSIGLPAEVGRPPELPPSAAGALIERGTEHFNVTRAITSLGSAPEADVRIAQPGVASMHAQIIAQNGHFFLRDLGSPSGTWLNGVALSGEHRLSNGDRIQVGRESLIFRLPGAAARPATQALLVQASRLLVQSGAKVGLAVRLAEHPLGVGSDPSNGLCLGDGGVAREHVRISRSGAGYVVQAVDPNAATWLRSQPLVPGRAEPLRPGDWLRVGSVDLMYLEDAREEPARALAPSARLTVDSGQGAGHSVTFSDVARVGSGPDAQLVLQGLAPCEVEFVRHGRGFFARDVVGQRTLRAGRPLGSNWVPLEHGDLLMLPGSRLLRFEEA
ncbi:MAG: FAD-dependent oxidoreductase [Myxococcota bacterium]